MVDYIREAKSMTVQQVAQRVMNLSDEGAALVGQLLDGLNPLFFQPVKTESIDVLRRFGAGKGIICNTDEFDGFNGEIAELFERFD